MHYYTSNVHAQEVEYVKQEAKLVYLLECLQKTAPPVLVFAEKTADVDDIHEYLLVKGVEAVAVHGGKDQQDREEAIDAFKVLATRPQDSVLISRSGSTCVGQARESFIGCMRWCHGCGRRARRRGPGRPRAGHRRVQGAPVMHSMEFIQAAQVACNGFEEGIGAVQVERMEAGAGARCLHRTSRLA